MNKRKNQLLFQLITKNYDAFNSNIDSDFTHIIIFKPSNMYTLKKNKKTSIVLILLSLFTIACNPKDQATKSEEATVDAELVYHVEGMTCDHCEMSIQKGVNELGGITEVEANHEDSTTRIVYNPAITDPEEIVAAIEKRGYHVVK